MDLLCRFKVLITKLVQVIKNISFKDNRNINTDNANNIQLPIVKLIAKNGKAKLVCSSSLKKGDIIEVSAGEIIPCDGEIIEGVATVDESAITGESAFVVREAGGDSSKVTGGTKVICNTIRIKILYSTKPVIKKEKIGNNKRIGTVNHINFEV